MSSISRSELREMAVTPYIHRPENAEEQHLETVRAGCSTLLPRRNPRNEDIVIYGEGEDVELVEEENYRSVHRINETPKLVAKKPCVPLIRDEAVKVLQNLKKKPASSLWNETFDYYSQRWFHTTRESEKALVEYVMLHPNNRPFYFSMQCRKLLIEDLPGLILTSLLSEPKETGQCVARFAIQTTEEMPFRVLFRLLEDMVLENSGFQLTDCLVTASLIELRGSKQTYHRLKTTNCTEYGELEPELDSQGRMIASSGSISCSIQGKRHVQLRITYSNNSSASSLSGRIKYIELEQTVKCINRRVLIVEKPIEIVEFDVEKDMVPLKDGIPPVSDLITYLKMNELDDYE